MTLTHWSRRSASRPLHDNTAEREQNPHSGHYNGLTRLKRSDEALPAVRKATELEPDRSRYAYVYAVALHSGGRRVEAITVLKEALKSHPGDREILQMLISFSREAGDATAALTYAEQLAVLMPDDQRLVALIRELRQSATSPAR
jgi:cytochrome c-type biogenesis protein CcmH/NrfG